MVDIVILLEMSFLVASLYWTALEVDVDNIAIFLEVSCLVVSLHRTTLEIDVIDVTSLEVRCLEASFYRIGL